MARSYALKVTVLGDAKGAMSAMSATEKRVTAFANKTSQLGTKLTRSLTLPFLAVGAIGAKELIEVENANRQTAAALKSTGGAANVTAEHIQNLADKMQRLAAVDAEEVQAAENVLLTFTKIRNEVGKGNKVFDKATLAIMDMSARLGQDLQSSATLVGKALQDPIRGLTAMRRVGVAFTDSQENMIRRLVETGDLLGAQKIILEELRVEFGGSAKAAGEGFGGQLKKLQFAAEDLAGELIKELMPTIQSIVDSVKGWIKAFSGLSDGTKDLIIKMGIFLALLGPSLKVMSSMAFASLKLAAGIKAVAGAVKMVTAVGGMSAFFGGAGAVGGAAAFAKGLGSIAMMAAPVAGVTAAFVGLAAGLNYASNRLGLFKDTSRFVVSSADLIQKAMKNSERVQKHALDVAQEDYNKFAGAAAGAMAKAKHATEKASRGLVNFARMTRTELKEWRGSVKGSLGVVSGAFDIIGNKAKLTSEKVIAAFKKKIEWVKDFSSNLKTLAARGLSEMSAATLATMGETGAAIAAALADGPKKDVKEFDATFRKAKSLEADFADKTKSYFSQARSGVDNFNTGLSTSIALIDQLIGKITGIPANPGGGSDGDGGSPGNVSGGKTGGPLNISGRSATTSITVQVDARGSAPGSEQNIRRAVAEALAEAARRDTRYARPRTAFG